MRSLKEYKSMKMNAAVKCSKGIPEVNEFRFKALKIALAGISLWCASSLLT